MANPLANAIYTDVRRIMSSNVLREIDLPHVMQLAIAAAEQLYPQFAHVLTTCVSGACKRNAVIEVLHLLVNRYAPTRRQARHMRTFLNRSAPYMITLLCNVAKGKVLQELRQRSAVAKLLCGS